MKKVLVVGGGAAGMMAAVFAARSGASVELFEKNEKLGKKLYITGKGRCNLTNNCEVEELLAHVCSNARFLYSGFYSFTAQDTMAFFEEAGTPLKTERGNRIFPASDHSYDVTAALERQMKRYRVQVHLRTAVQSLLLEEMCGTLQETAPADKKCEAPCMKLRGLRLADGREIPGDAVIVATGGLSYASTGSTGDGYRFAQEAGHTLTEQLPALVPMNVKEPWAKELQGLSLRNVEMTIYSGKKKLYEEFGEMLFTHFGVSGPLVLTASSYVGARLKKQELRMTIDLKPALSREQLDARVLRDFDAASNKNFKNILSGLLPARLQPVMLSLCGIDPEKKVHLVSREERLRFVDLMKNLELTLTGLRGYNEAVITRGGVSVREVNPSTMESKKASGLYFAGEVLDLDAVTGGFNLQIAWSTGYLAGCASAAEEELCM